MARGQTALRAHSPRRPRLTFPRLTFEEARAQIEARIARDAADPEIDARAYPRLYHHGARTARSTVLFHGLTNCPQQFDEFARLLHARGENVYVPRLPFHGHKNRLTRAIGNITLADIEAAATDAARLGAGLGENVNALGLSLGATMALQLAQAGIVNNAVGVAPFLMVPLIPRGPGMLLMHALDTLPNRFLWWNPRRKEMLPPVYAYPGFWTHCLARCIFAGAALIASAGKAPPVAPRCTMVINAQDPAVNNAVARELAAHWQAHGATYALTVWDDLGKVHDVIDPSTYPTAPTRVYPRLAALLEDNRLDGSLF